MNVSDIVKSLVSDFQNFYEDGYKPNITVNFDATPTIASIKRRKSGEDTIELNCYLSSSTIESPNDIFYVAFIFCHELTHQLFNHNGYKESSPHETRAIESWADFYGIQLALLIIDFGTQTKALLKTFPIYDFNKQISYIRGSLEKIYIDVFDRSEGTSHYANKITRVGYFVAGVCSYWQKVNYYCPETCIAIHAALLKGFSDQHSHKEMHLEKDIPCTFDSIHRYLQGDGHFDLCHCKPEYKCVLDVKFNTTPAQKELYKQISKQSYSKLGFDFDY